MRGCSFFFSKIFFCYSITCYCSIWIPCNNHNKKPLSGCVKSDCLERRPRRREAIKKDESSFSSIVLYFLFSSHIFPASHFGILILPQSRKPVKCFLLHLSAQSLLSRLLFLWLFVPHICERSPFQ